MLARTSAPHRLNSKDNKLSQTMVMKTFMADSQKNRD